MAPQAPTIEAHTSLPRFRRSSASFAPGAVQQSSPRRCRARSEEAAVLGVARPTSVFDALWSSSTRASRASLSPLKLVVLDAEASHDENLIPDDGCAPRSSASASTRPPRPRARVAASRPRRASRKRPVAAAAEPALPASPRTNNRNRNTRNPVADPADDGSGATSAPGSHSHRLGREPGRTVADRDVTTFADADDGSLLP